ncbi:Hypothetical predicted protein [Olea europaea subsp. europaea]|uniref:Phospholipase A1 n=1 Tax=Olea europaea subsp. europaea TaxID=158383 RepID=A0A8S0RUM6_OLEEU|nr:Hypothetical predicted protein [Olea europaea subsp. europaea]
MVDSPQTEPTWPELLGRDDWNGLLDPLSLSLRRLILRCGDFCQATYDAFNNDGNSKNAGSSRYGKNSFFTKSCWNQLLIIKSTVSSTQLRKEAWDRETNWIGYTAVTTDEVSRVRGRREAYVVWRGTSRNYEWLNVLGARPESADPLLRPNSWEKKSPDDSSSSDEDENEPKFKFPFTTIPTRHNMKHSLQIMPVTRIARVLQTWRFSVVNLQLDSRVEKNKGMVLDENGDWILAPLSDEDQPVPEF